MMDHAPRYQPVSREEDDQPAQHVDLALMVHLPSSPQEEDNHEQSPPPAYDGAYGTSIPPPSYDIATDLPSYAEAERTKKAMDEEMRKSQQQQDSDFLIHHLNDVDDTSSISSDRNKEVELGTDCVFFLAFITCFLFNWFGVIAVLCLVHTVAGRYGALAGFGLSMVKWAVIIKNNQWANNYVASDSWLWWIFLTLGILLCLRGYVQYIRIRMQWPELSASRRTRFYYFY